MKLPLIKHSGGQESVSFTMLVIGFLTVTMWMLLSIFESLFGLQIREFSGSEAMSYLTPLCLLYFARRWKETVGSSGNEALDDGIDISVDESEMGPPVSSKKPRVKSSK